MSELEEYREKWIKIATDCSDTDLKIVRGIIRQVYRTRMREMPRKLLLTDSPLACLHSLPFIKKRTKLMHFNNGPGLFDIAKELKGDPYADWGGAYHKLWEGQDTFRGSSQHRWISSSLQLASNDQI